MEIQHLTNRTLKISGFQSCHYSIFAGEVHPGGYDCAWGGEPAGVGPVCVHAEQPGEVYGSEWA